MEQDPKALYQEVIMQHNREPVHYEKVAAMLTIEAYNPLCGDQFKLFLDMEGDRVVKAHFYGYGCAISKASTSILVKKIEGLTAEEIRKLFHRFEEVVKGAQAHLAEPDRELHAFSAARQFPGRLTCATLSWNALIQYLDERETKREML